MTKPRETPEGLVFDAKGSRYFEGDVPLGHPVTLIANTVRDTIIIGFPDSARDDIRWPVGDIRQLSDHAGKGGAMLHWTGDPLARLFCENTTLVSMLPHRKRRAPPKGRGRLAAWAVAAVAAVALQIGLLVPMIADRLAEYVPPEGERALGEATFGQIREALDETGLNPLEICEGQAGNDALARMLARLTDGRALAQPPQVYVLDHPMINAFALPGGYVVFFKGLIDAAGGPDEVAAVMAHEIGHVVSRDPTRHAMRSAGSIGVLGLLFGDFAGGAAVLFLANRLISAKYSQGAESGADEFALEMLEDANISPAALGDMFDRMRAKSGDIDGLVAHFISHPSLGVRIDVARGAVLPGANYTPSISASDWRAIQNMCD